MGGCAVAAGSSGLVSLAGDVNSTADESSETAIGISAKNNQY
jgi:hypothetical protein